MLFIFLLVISSCAISKSEFQKNRCCDETAIKSEISDLEKAQNLDTTREFKAYNEYIGEVSSYEEVLVKTFSLAAEGNPTALNILGEMYLSGTDGLPKNNVEALHAFEMAGSKGNSNALMRLLNIYSKNKNAPQDIAVLTYCYASLAATLGSEAAKILVVQLEMSITKRFPQCILDELQAFVLEKYRIILRNVSKNLDEIELITTNDQKESARIYKLMLEQL